MDKTSIERTDESINPILKATDIPGYDAEEKHGFGDCDALESWLQDSGFELFYDNGPQFHAWWNKSAGLMVWPQPFRQSPELGEFKVFDAPTKERVGALCNEWWRE